MTPVMKITPAKRPRIRLKKYRLERLERLETFLVLERVTRVHVHSSFVVITAMTFTRTTRTTMGIIL
jgi:hypothetical protein